MAASFLAGLAVCCRAARSSKEGLRCRAGDGSGRLHDSERDRSCLRTCTTAQRRHRRSDSGYSITGCRWAAGQGSGSLHNSERERSYLGSHTKVQHSWLRAGCSARKCSSRLRDSDGERSCLGSHTRHRHSWLLVGCSSRLRDSICPAACALAQQTLL